MNVKPHPNSREAAPDDERRGARLRRSLLACAAALLLASCGGGGDGGSSSAGVGSGGTGTYSSGRITGFGSIIVNGVHFDQASAAVSTEDGTAATPAQLQLGMTVEIDGILGEGTQGDGGRGKALAIRYRSELLGPVDNVAGAVLTVMGQQVNVDAATRWGGGLSALADVAPGSLVEVYGYQDAASGAFVATRIEARDPAGVSRYKVRGVVSDLDYGTMTCRIGGQLMSYSPTLSQFGVLVDGRVARAVLHTAPSAGRWTVQAMDVSQPLVASRDSATIEGAVTLVGPASTVFSVDGLPVDVRLMSSCAACAGLQPGTLLRVSGRLENGTLLAAEVQRLP